MLWLPGIVFLAVCAWVVRKLFVAARNEAVMTEQRLASFAGELPRAELAPPPKLSPIAAPPLQPLDGADLANAEPLHLPLVEQMVAEREQQLRAQHPGAAGRSVEVLWVRSNPTHVAWCERRHPASPAARPRDVICVAKVHNGAVAERWTFG